MPGPSRRLSTETKSAFKTTEFIAYIVVLAGILVAGAVATASHYAGAHDPFRADRVWLYATILTVGYMISRGLALVRRSVSLPASVLAGASV